MPWTDEGRKAAADRMRKLHADPEFIAKKLAGVKSPETRKKIMDGRHGKSPLRKLTAEQQAEYRILMKNRYTAAEALAAVTGTTGDKEARP